MDMFAVLETDLQLGEQVARGAISAEERERMVARMAEWREISGGPSSYWDKAEPIEGVLVEVLEHQGQFDKPVYVIKTDEGNVGVNATTVIETKMNHVPLGYLVRVTALGETKSEKTGRTYQDFKVEIGGMAMQEVADKAAKPDASPAIGDEDIPF